MAHIPQQSSEAAPIDRALEGSLRALGSAHAPHALSAAVLEEVTNDARQRPLRLGLAAASFAGWAVAMHWLVVWTAEQLQLAV